MEQAGVDSRKLAGSRSVRRAGLDGYLPIVAVYGGGEFGEPLIMKSSEMPRLRSKLLSVVFISHPSRIFVMLHHLNLKNVVCVQNLLRRVLNLCVRINFLLLYKNLKCKIPETYHLKVSGIFCCKIFFYFLS